MQNMTKEQLRDLIVAADDEALLEGYAPKQRGLHIVSKVMKKLGVDGFTILGENAHPMVAQILGVHSALYCSSDLAIGGVHGGVFMFRDVFARIDIPIVFGQAVLDPFTLTDLTKNQLGWLASRPKDVRLFLDQFSDIADFAGGIGGSAAYKLPPKAALELFWLAAFQLQGAAAALSVAFDFRGAIQSALIGTELAIKAGLVAGGATEQGYRKHGHDLKSAANAFREKYANFDVARILRVISIFPKYVENRYSPIQPSRIETGHLVMGAQYIAGEVMRQVAGYTIRDAALEPMVRTYPA